MKKNNSTPIATISTPSFEDFKKPIFERNLDAIKILINTGPVIPFNDYLKVLHYSVELGHVEVLELLIEDMDPHSINNPEIITNMSPDSIQPNRLSHKTALHKAVEKGHIEIVKFLLKKIISINTGDKDGKTALHYASLNGNIEVLEYLIEKKGVDVNQADKYGKTALHYAAQEGYIDVVQLLVSHMQDYEINQADYSGETALHKAAENGRIDLVALLIEKGVDLNQVNKKNESTALDKAAEKGHTNLVKWIIAQGNVDLSYCKGMKVLRKAAENGHTDVVKILLPKMTPYSINQLIAAGIFRLAAKSGSIDLVELLIDRGIDVNQPDQFGYTALHEAASLGHTDLVRWIIEEKKVDVNKADKYGETALHFAAERGSIKVVELLLQKMTPEAINQANQNGATVLGLAKEYNNKDVVNLITYYKKLHDLTAKEPSIDNSIEDSFEFYSGGGETKKLITADVFKKLLLQKYPELALFEEYLNNLQILQISTNESSSFEVKESVEKFFNIAWEFKEESTNKIDDIDLMFVEQGSFEGVKMTFLQIKYGYASLFDIVEILEKLQKREPLQSQESRLLEYFKKDLRIDNDSELFDEKGGINSKLITEDYIEGKAVQDKEKEAIEFFIHNPEYRVAGSFFKMAIEKHKDKLVDRINSDKDFKDAILELKNYILPLEIKKFIKELERQDSTDETESSKGFEVETANGDYEDFNEVERKLDEEDLESTSVTTFSDRLTDYHNEARIEGEERVQSISEERVESTNLFSNPEDVFESHGIELNNVVVTGDIENHRI
jgi:ankyrin repeat protein